MEQGDGFLQGRLDSRHPRHHGHIGVHLVHQGHGLAAVIAHLLPQGGRRPAGHVRLFQVVAHMALLGDRIVKRGPFGVGDAVGDAERLGVVGRRLPVGGVTDGQLGGGQGIPVERGPVARPLGVPGQPGGVDAVLGVGRQKSQGASVVSGRPPGVDGRLDRQPGQLVAEGQHVAVE